MRSRIALAAAIVGTALFAWAAALPPTQDRPPRQDYDSGAHLYREFCASCHGQRGKGDGPIADLSRTPPSDVTTLTRRHGGTFPRDEVLAMLEGTRRVPGHHGPGMPQWRSVLLRAAHGDERRVRKQLQALVGHLESIQDTR